MRGKFSGGKLFSVLVTFEATEEFDTFYPYRTMKLKYFNVEHEFRLP